MDRKFMVFYRLNGDFFIQPNVEKVLLSALV